MSEQHELDPVLIRISLQYAGSQRSFFYDAPYIPVQSLPEGTPVYTAIACQCCDSHVFVVRDGTLMCTGCDTQQDIDNA